MHLVFCSCVMYLALLVAIAQIDIPRKIPTVGRHLDRSLHFLPNGQSSDEVEIFKTDHDLSGPPLDTNCTISTFRYGLMADCSYRRISDISKLRLAKPGQIAELNLRGNFIQNIPLGVWTSFGKLTHLNLENNLLSGLENHTFVGLTHLKWLNLQGNALAMTRRNFPESVFSPLLALETLYLNNNTASNYTGRSASNGDEDQLYPDWALASLTSLKNLYIDGLPETLFGPGFKNMTRLSHLSMSGHSGYCNHSRLHYWLFNNVRQLQRLTMQRCLIQLNGIDPNVLRPLKKLTHLDVSRNVDIDLDGLVSLLRSQLHSPKLTHLNVNMVVNPYSVSRCVSNELARNLPRSLTHLSAGSNNLEIVSDQVFQLLPKNLSYLNLNNNRFFFGTYLRNMSFMTSLKTLKMNGLSQGYNLPKYFSALDQRPAFDCTMSTQGSRENIVFKLPPKLEVLEMNSADLSLSITDFSVHPNNSLKHLSLHKNNIPFLVGSVTGLHQLETLDLSRNNIEFISQSFFLDWNIKLLNLSENDFNSYLNHHTLSLSFPSTLQVLDLSNTNVGYFNMNFSTLTNLETLLLKNSRVRRFVPNLYFAQNMNFLDLSDNFLYMLRPSVTEAMSSFPNLTIDLSENTIGCYCDTIEFIDWLVHYPRLTDKNLSRMSCDRDGDVRRIPDFLLEYQLLRRQCTSNLLLLSISTSVCTSLLLLNFVFIAYRYRWKLRFWYYSAYLYISSNKEQGTCRDFQADVNIAYCTDDEDFAEATLANALEGRGLRVHIPGRDSRVGAWMFKDIVETVQTCRRTLVVLTPQMLKCKWCQATVNLAAQEAVSSNRTVLVFLVLTSVQSDQLGTSLLYLIQHSDMFFYPPKENWRDDRAMGLFWRKLVRDLH